MNMSSVIRSIHLSVLGCVAAVFCTAAGCAQRPAQQREATILQVVERFNRPESCAVSLDGQHLFVGNCASAPEGLRIGQGAISKVAINADGTVNVDGGNLRFVEKLNGPLGMGVLPKAAGKIPAGALFVNTGYAWAADAQGNRVTDVRRLAPGVAIFDAQTGRPLGRIDTGPGSAIARAVGHPLVKPNGLTFDTDGNLYIIDNGGAADVQPPLDHPHGLLRMPNGSLEALAAGRPAPVQFLPIPHNTNGVLYSARDKALYFNGGTDPKITNVYRLSPDRLDKLPEPIARNVGTADGYAQTRNGTLIVSRFDQPELLVIPRRGEPYPLRLDRETRFVNPSDHKLHTLPDGRMILYLPDQELAARQDWQQRLYVIELPEGL
jgi:hypothetical protein